MLSKTWIIARRELMAFFNTWMGYVIACAAVLITGLLFNSFAIGDSPKFSGVVLQDFFYFTSGIIMVAAVFLAMRLFAEEKQSGTLVLLFTSPIKERALVYGKFLSAVVFFALLLICTLHLPLLILLEGKISWGQLGVGYLGLMLLGMATLAISLFASVISPNQLIAGILGSSLVVGMLVLWLMSYVVNKPFSDLFSYLAIHNQHFIPFTRGVLQVEHVVYYLSVCVFFLECSIRVLEARRLQG